MDRVESPAPGEPGTPASADGGGTGRLAVVVAAYVGARLLLLAVLAGALVLFGVPLLPAMLIALIISLPLSLLLFRNLRSRLNAEIEVATAERRARRERLRAELRGE